MADYLKLFLAKRLSPSLPDHAEYIKGRLAAMKSEGKQQYHEYSEFYGYDVEVKSVEKKVPEEKKKAGRPKKV